MALPAPNLRRRPCYANSGLLVLQRLRSVRLRWRRRRLPPGTAAAGTVVVARHRLGRTPRHRRRPCLLWRLWLRRLLRAAFGPDPLGPALAPDQPLLLIEIAGSGVQKPRSRARLGFLLGSTPRGTRSRLHSIFTRRACNPLANETISAWMTWSHVNQQQRARSGTRDVRPNQRKQRTDRSRHQPIDLPCRRRTVATRPSPGKFRAAFPSPAPDGCVADGRTTAIEGWRRLSRNAFRHGGLQQRFSRTNGVAFGSRSGDNPACFQSPTFRSGSPDGF